MSTLPRISDRPLNDQIVTSLVASQFPELSGARVTGWDEGADNEAVEINGEWVFRFPKRAECESHLRSELALLPHLAPRLPVPVPQYRFVGTPGPLFPYLFAGYRKLRGTPAIQLGLGPGDALALAPALGAVLSAVHSLPADEACCIGVRRAEDDPQSRVLEALEELRAVRGELRPESYEGCRLYLEQSAAAGQGYQGPPRLLHADFSAEHILLSPDGRRVEGVIDWTDAEVGDPAFDFGYLWVWHGERLVDEILRHYALDVDPGLRDRVQRDGVCQAIADLHYGVAGGGEKYRWTGRAAFERAFPAGR
jgi:aminoglycoside phosphotransferase (APT) family kinase protein